MLNEVARGAKPLASSVLLDDTPSLLNQRLLVDAFALSCSLSQQVTGSTSLLHVLRPLACAAIACCLKLCWAMRLASKCFEHVTGNLTQQTVWKSANHAFAGVWAA